MRIASVGAVALLLLAGCSGGPSKDPVKDADFTDLGLDATATTGVIRGVVVDDAVRPLAGVAVTARGGDGGAEQAATTTAEGTFGFDGLAPGTYFVKASKAGFRDAQQSVDVVAGVAEPPIVKVQIAPDPALRPYFEAYTFEGFLECGVTGVFVGVALCLAPNLVTGENVTNDHTQVTYDLARTPTWVQTEMVWESTQETGDELSLEYSWTGDCGLLCDWEVNGTSPLLLQANQTTIDGIGLGAGNGLYIRVFNDDLEATDPHVRECTPIPDPVLGATWCTGAGVGVTVEQKFDHYTHVFYGYVPPADWRFTENPEVPQPPA
jgi:hypothetical protein